jgi:hypothetical protein
MPLAAPRVVPDVDQAASSRRISARAGAGLTSARAKATAGAGGC